VSALEALDDAACADLVDETLLLAADAREDPCAFFEFVMREERSQLPVKLPPHMRVMLEFMRDHERPVVIAPIGHGKTSVNLAFTLWMLGRNPSLRGAIVSATQEQSMKVVGAVARYIETSAELHLVFPDLRRSSREGDHWTQTHLVVERPTSAKDDSLVAYGMDGSTPGTRLDWAIVDDMLNMANTRTKEGCMKVREWVQTSVSSRMEKAQKLIVTNTPWHPEDLVMAMMAQGWPTLRLKADGNIFVQDDIRRIREAEDEGVPFVPWDSNELRPLETTSVVSDPMALSEMPLRLVAHDPDPDFKKTLWPERIDAKQLEQERSKYEAGVFLQLYMCECRDPDSAWCRPEWIDRCKQLARLDPKAFKDYAVETGRSAEAESLRRYLPGAKPMWGLVTEYKGPYQAFTGVDLAFGEKASSDDIAMFTFVPLPTGHRLILDIEIGKFNAPTVARKIAEKHKRFGSILTVESVSGQKHIVQLLQSSVKETRGVPIKAFNTTGSLKASIDNGIPILFAEIEQGLWLIPSDKTGAVDRHVQKWIEGLRNYRPSAHTPDAMMAMLFARYQARAYGLLSGGAAGGKSDLDFSSR
jgi:hypothetical protein